MLCGMNELDQNRIAALLAMPEVRLEVLQSAGSTNDLCRAALAAGAERCLAVAAAQTGGRGRRGLSARRAGRIRGGARCVLACVASCARARPFRHV